MKGIEGDLSLMSLPDLMQWAEMNRKTGTLIIESHGIAKIFYFQEGKIIFVSSQREGERLGDFFASIGDIEKEKITRVIRESQRLGIPFTGYLLSEKIVDRKTLEEGVGHFAERVLLDALRWDSGKFKFTHEMPLAVQNGPVRLNTSFVVFQALKLFDEMRIKEAAPDIHDVVNQLAKRISEGNIDLPIVPDIMVKLNRFIRSDDVSVHDVARLIMADQILTSKILKVVNSSFYSPSYKITSLQQAIIYMGFKSILSIVTVYTLSSMSPKNAGRVKEILLHSLLCAFVAKRIAVDIRTDPEEAFVCGLLHDIGKTVLLNIIPEYALPRGTADTLIEEYHQHAGYLVAVKWNFSDEVQYAVRYHHNPEEAPLERRKIVEIIYLANLIANGQDESHIPSNALRFITLDKINMRHLLDELQSIKGTVDAMF